MALKNWVVILTYSHRNSAGPDVSASLEKGHLIFVVQTLTAVLDGLVDAQQSGVAQLLEEFVSRKYLIFFPLYMNLNEKITSMLLNNFLI